MTEEVTMENGDQLSLAAQELSRVGASKGGKARAAALTADERKAIARQAAEARWGKSKISEEEEQALPKATHTGELHIGALVLPCAVLDDGRRVLSERGMLKALGRGRGGQTYKRKQASLAGGAPVPAFISGAALEPFIPASLRLSLSQPKVYRGRDGGKANGVEAILLPEICEVWLKARDAGVLQPSQEHIANKADVLMRGLAHVGIIALVDEATGYQQDRDRNELHRILEAYISKELLPWTKRFPDEFYQELFRLRGWPYSPPSPKRPKYVGKLTNELVYEKLPPGVLHELQAKNPVVKDGWRRYRHHQFLTMDIGNPHLERHLVAVTTLMRAAKTWGVFKRLFAKAFPGLGIQQEMDLGLDSVEEEEI
jgi:hypothetical protein